LLPVRKIGKALLLMRTREIEAIGELTGEALAAAGSLIGDMHEGIASRPFGILGAAALPVRAVHDRVSQTVYGGVERALKAAPTALGAGAARRARDGDSLQSTPVGAFALAVLNGFYGHHLAQRESELALQMTLRHQPPRGDRIAVFVHGLCETDEAWSGIPPAPERPTYGDRLRADLGFTPVYVRYNTGLHVSENGAQLAQQLDQLLAQWPSTPSELVLVGHSMGGLVARSACRFAELNGLACAEQIRHVFCLGTPHLGADLEKGANVLGWALGRLPETRAMSKIINARSSGIKDLRFGSCVEADWCDCDPDEFLRDRCQEVPFLETAAYYFIGAALSPAPLGRALGDLLVRMPSASGRGNGKGRRIPFEIDNGYELSGLTHFDLLNHPAVYEQLRSWLARAAQPPRELTAATG
jgi:pimeloyl-ACP methyl ester carboxylesterase